MYAIFSKKRADSSHFILYDIVMRLQKRKKWVSDLVPSACSHVLFPRWLFDQFWFHKREHFSFFRTNIVVVHKDIYPKYYKNSNISYTSSGVSNNCTLCIYSFQRKILPCTFISPVKHSTMTYPALCAYSILYNY